MRSRFLWFAGLTLLLIAAPAFADTFNYCGTGTGGSTCASTAPSNGFLITADLATSGTNFTLTMTFTNSTASAAYLNDFTISLLGGGANPTISGTLQSPPTGWTEVDNAKTTNSNGQPAGCRTGNGFGGWLCATSDTAADAILLAANGGTVTLTFTGTYSGTVTTPFELIADAGTSNVTGNNKALTISAPMNTPAPSPVPEPTSLLLLGSGLLAVGITLRNKRSA